jgi:hypothetical protein
MVTSGSPQATNSGNDGAGSFSEPWPWLVALVALGIAGLGIVALGAMRMSLQMGGSVDRVGLLLTPPALGVFGVWVGLRCCWPSLGAGLCCSLLSSLRRWGSPTTAERG